MSNSSSIRIFIGSGEASRLERKVLIYSLLKHSRGDLEIYVFNGTHNTVEPMNGEPYIAPLSLKAKYSNVTEFSNYRFLIPELCGHEGRAIWLDSDMLALWDIGELFNSPMGDASFLATSEAYGASKDHRWGLSVALYDCDRTRFDVDSYMQEIDLGSYKYGDLHQMTPSFLEHHSFSIGSLAPEWNVFDKHDGSTKLIHYTNLLTQPWKFPGHPYGEIWFKYFDEARSNGVVTDRDIELSKLRAYVRQDILDGNQSLSPLARISRKVLCRFF